MLCGMTTPSASTGPTALQSQIAALVGQGFTVDHNDGTTAVLSRKKPLSIPLNLLGVVLTGGLWLVYILIRIVNPKVERRTIHA